MIKVNYFRIPYYIFLSSRDRENRSSTFFFFESLENYIIEEQKNTNSNVEIKMFYLENSNWSTQNISISLLDTQEQINNLKKNIESIITDFEAGRFFEKLRR